MTSTDRITLIANIRATYPDIKNITEAVKQYNEDQDDEVPVFVSTKTHGNLVPNILDMLDLPSCPECGEKLLIRQKCSGMRDGDYITIVKCTKCKYIDLSEKTIEEWLKGE